MKTLVLYVFHEYNKRVERFIRNSIFYAEDVDFMVIVNNKTIQFEVPDYVKILRRDNIGFDFGGWTDGLLTNEIYKSYDNFIFVNSSVVGPFLRSGRWTDIYINGLTGNVKLFGSTINTCCENGDPSLCKPHVQSYIFAMNKSTVHYLIDKGIFGEYTKTFVDTIWNKEVRMSRVIIENGWNIGSLLKVYKDVDFTIPNFTTFYDDVMYPIYRNNLWDDYDLVFIKGNRMNII